MTKCKKKNCSNEVQEGEKYCKLHRSKIEEVVKGTIGLGTTLEGLVLFRKIKK